MATEKSYTIGEAAKKIKVSRQAIYDAVSSKPPRLKSSKQTRTITKRIEAIVISESDLQAFKETISRSHQERGKKN